MFDLLKKHWLCLLLGAGLFWSLSFCPLIYNGFVNSNVCQCETCCDPCDCVEACSDDNCPCCKPEVAGPAPEFKG
mgnify:CR=1 FL=1